MQHGWQLSLQTTLGTCWVQEARIVSLLSCLPIHNWDRTHNTWVTNIDALCMAFKMSNRIHWIKSKGTHNIFSIDCLRRTENQYDIKKSGNHTPNSNLINILLIHVITTRLTLHEFSLWIDNCWTETSPVCVMPKMVNLIKVARTCTYNCDETLIPETPNQRWLSYHVARIIASPTCISVVHVSGVYMSINFNHWFEMSYLHSEFM